MQNVTNITTTIDPYEQFWKDYYQLRDLYHPTLGITLLTLCLIGLVTNLLNIIALSMIVRYSKLPVYRCFLGLSIADFMVVLLQAIYSGNHFLVKEELIVDDLDAYLADRSTNIIHHIVPHLMNIFFAASNWSVAVMSIFRFIAVFTPLWYQRCCTKKIVDIILVAVYVFSVIINIPSFIITSYNTEHDRFEMEDLTEIIGFNPKYISLIMVQFLPIIITVLLLVPLIIKLCSQDAIERSASNSEYRGRDRRQTSLTLIIISTFCVICLAPNLIHLTWRYLAKDSYAALSPIVKGRFHVAVQICMFTNYVANFFFYILLNAKLRRKLKRLICCVQIKFKQKGGCLGIQLSLSDKLSDSDKNSFRSHHRYSKSSGNFQNGSLRDFQKKRREIYKIERHRFNSTNSNFSLKSRTEDVNGNVHPEEEGLLEKKYCPLADMIPEDYSITNSSNHGNHKLLVSRELSTDTTELSSSKDLSCQYDAIGLVVVAKVATLETIKDLADLC